MSVTRWPGERLLAAQQRNLTHDERLDTLSLTALHRKVPALPVAQAITGARVTLTINGPSFLELDLHDPLWLVERSGLLDRNTDGRLDSVAVAVDGLRFRLSASRRRDPETLTLEFEDEAKALLDQHTRKLSSSRGTMTRGQFIERMVREVTVRDLDVFIPQAGVKQAVARPDLPDSRPQGSTTGFDDGVTFNIQGQTADAQQMREVATAMTVCDQEDVTDRVRLAEIVAAIGESLFRDVPNAAGSPYSGVHQALKTRHLSTAEQVRYFIRGDQGFQAGGAAQAAREHPDWSAGTIAYKVEGDRANFPSDAAAERFYQQWHAEAVTIADLWNGGTGGDRQVLTFKQYTFTRGQPGQKETSWQAATRLAQEVGWRFYALGGLVCFVSDDYLIGLASPWTLGWTTDDRGLHAPPGVLGEPAYDWNHGKRLASIELRVVADAWSVVPGECITINLAEPVSGKWIVETFEFDLLNTAEATVTAIKPIPEKKEPAATALLTDSGTGPDATTAGAARAVAWARSKIGHYREEFGSNRGSELDRLEQGFSMQGAPWCAMFATTAVVQGGVNRDCRTAAVAQINAWCAEGSHGYERGFKATPRPGDLMTFGNEHVGIVEKVDARGVTTIEGNTSAGEVQSVGRLRTGGRFVRPRYPT